MWPRLSMAGLKFIKDTTQREELFITRYAAFRKQHQQKTLKNCRIYARQCKTLTGLKINVRELHVFEDRSSDNIARNQVTAVIYLYIMIFSCKNLFKHFICLIQPTRKVFSSFIFPKFGISYTFGSKLFIICSKFIFLVYFIAPESIWLFLYKSQFKQEMGYCCHIQAWAIQSSLSTLDRVQRLLVSHLEDGIFSSFQ